MRRWIWVAMLAASLVWGCAEDLVKHSEITRLKLIGIKVEVEPGAGGRQRVWPRPGETARARFDVVHPAYGFDPAKLRSLLIVCTAGPSFEGQVICQELFEGEAQLDELGEQLGGNTPSLRVGCDDFDDTEVSGVRVMCQRGPPEVTLDVPADATANRLITGVLCDNAEPFIDPREPGLFGCDSEEPKEDEDRTELFTATIPIALPEYGPTNHHPSFSDTSILIKGPSARRQVTWHPIAPEQMPESEDDCASLAVGPDAIMPALFPNGPELDRDRPHRITLQFEDSDRELEPPFREDLQIAYYASRGDIEEFDVIEGSEADPRIDAEWEIEEDELEEYEDEGAPLGPSGKIVRFFFTLRDRRGGYDSTMRVACVCGGDEGCQP